MGSDVGLGVGGFDGAGVGEYVGGKLGAGVAVGLSVGEGKGLLGEGVGTREGFGLTVGGHV